MPCGGRDDRGLATGGRKAVTSREEQGSECAERLSAKPIVENIVAIVAGETALAAKACGPSRWRRRAA